MHKFAKSDGKTRCADCLTPFGDHGCPRHPHLPGAPGLARFFQMVQSEVARARLLYDPEAVQNALTEEVGELAAAYADEPRERIIHEAVQVCAMAIRTALEGDPLMAPHREKRGLDR